MTSKSSLNIDIISDLLSKMAEKSESVYWLTSPNLKKINYVSPAYEKIWGRSREALYKNPGLWITYLHPEDSNGYHPIQAMAEKIATLGADARYEESYRIIQPNGEVRWIIDRGFPICENGICYGVTGVAIDITKEKLYEVELQKAKEKAVEANRVKTEFLSNAVTEIKEPFEKIRAALTKNKMLDVENALLNINQILDDMENFSKFDLANKNQNASEDLYEPTRKISKSSNEGLKIFERHYNNFNVFPRESQCMYYLIRGMSAKQIGKKLGLSPRTVEFYLNNAKTKMGCKTRQELIEKLIASGVF